MKCKLEQVVGVVSRYVARSRGLPPSSITAESQLFREGLIDSFGLVELSAELETALGVTLPEGALIPDDFETPETLFRRLQEI